MSLPITGLSDEELEDYAGLHPEAAQELAARIASGQFIKNDTVAELKEELSNANVALDEAERDLDNLRDATREAIRVITDEKGNPVLNKKTKAPRVGLCEFVRAPAESAACPTLAYCAEHQAD